MAECVGADETGPCEKPSKRGNAIRIGKSPKKKKHTKEEKRRICTNVYQPVCDEDGNKYSNECMAKCVGADKTRPREQPKSKPSCIGAKVYQAVKRVQLFNQLYYAR